MEHPLRIYFVLLLISFTHLIGSDAAFGDTLDVVVNGEKLKVRDGRRNPDSSEPLTLIESSAVPNYQPSSSSSSSSPSSSSNYQPSSGPPQAWPMWSFPAMPTFQWWNPWAAFGMPNNNNNKNTNNNGRSSSSSNSDDDKKSKQGRIGK